MNKYILYLGASIMIICGIIFCNESAESVGIGLLWVGISLEDNG